MENINGKIRTELVEVNTASGVTNNYNFGQLPNLREAKRIISIEAFDRGQVSVTPLNKATVTNTVLIKSVLKLVELGGSAAEIRQLPLYAINTQGTAKQIPQLNCQPVDWEKSTMFIPETTGLTAGDSFLLLVTYEKK